MEELQLALTAARVEQKNFGLWLKSWQVGQVLQALVTDKFPSGQLVLRVAGQQITATADIPVQKGAVLTLEVNRLTPTPTLKIIDAPVASVGPTWTSQRRVTASFTSVVTTAGPGFGSTAYFIYYTSRCQYFGVAGVEKY